MLTEAQNEMITHGDAYWCDKCKRVHRIDSIVGKLHIGISDVNAL